MIRFVFRFFGVLLLALAFILLIYDGTRSIGANAILVTRATEFWSSVHQGSREAFEIWVKQSAPGWVWDSVLRSVLEQPTWLVLGIVAAILIVVGRKKKPLIGYARR
jgi:hypothetical protein